MSVEMARVHVASLLRAGQIILVAVWGDEIVGEAEYYFTGEPGITLRCTFRFCTSMLPGKGGGSGGRFSKRGVGLARERGLRALTTQPDAEAQGFYARQGLACGAPSTIAVGGGRLRATTLAGASHFGGSNAAPRAGVAHRALSVRAAGLGSAMAGVGRLAGLERSAPRGVAGAGERPGRCWGLSPTSSAIPLRPTLTCGGNRKRRWPPGSDGAARVGRGSGLPCGRCSARCGGFTRRAPAFPAGISNPPGSLAPPAVKGALSLDDNGHPDFGPVVERLCLGNAEDDDASKKEAGRPRFPAQSRCPFLRMGNSWKPLVTLPPAT